MLLDEFLALAHQRADRGGGGVEDVDLVLGADLPEAAGIGVGRHALEHHRGRPVGEGPVDDVAVAGDPADIGGAPVDVALVVVEDVFVGHRRIGEITAGGVHDALRRAGGAGGVEDEERILGIHHHGLAMIGDALHLLVEPDVAVGIPGNVVAGATNHELLHAGHAFERLVGIGLQGREAAAARRLVGGDDELGAGALDAGAQGIGGEAGEDDGMDRADAGAGEHGIGGLRDHREVEDDPVALLDAHRMQDVAELGDLLVELLVGDVLAHLGVVAFPDDGGLVGAVLQVAIDAVGGDVELAVLEPFDRDVVEVERCILDLGIGPDPVQPLAVLAPERIRIGHGRLVHRRILLRIDVGISDDVRRGLVHLVCH